MTDLPNTTYVLLGRCLAPCLTGEQQEKLIGLFSRDDVRWDRLLSEANRQQCTPLWYVRLKEHGLLHLLPADLQAYLAELTAANRTRCQRLRDELARILKIFAYARIPAILLDGTAVFANGLYGDEAARLIDAMDLLVPHELVNEAERLLMMEGYVDHPAQSRLDDRQSHLPTLYHMRKNATVKLHFALAAGSAANVWDMAAVWRKAAAGEISGHPAGWLPPTQRLLYNALHATQFQGAFLRGNLGLADLAEFAALLERYREDIDWEWFWIGLKAHGLILKLATYVHLVNRLMGERIDPPHHPKTQWHLNRIATSHRPVFGGLKRGERWRNHLWRFKARAYGLVKLPGWTWQNTCASRRDATLRERMGCLTRSMRDPYFIKSALHTQAP